MKTAWALGAAFVAVVLVLIVFGVLATEMGSAERLSSMETLDGIDVPTIGTVGDFPDPAHRVVVNVTADGNIVIDGNRIVGQDPLVATLTRRRASRNDGISESLVIRADARSAWGVAQRIVVACSRSGVDRVFFVGRHESDSVEGAVFACWPKAMKPAIGASDSVRRVAVWSADGSAAPEGVYDDLAETPAARTGNLFVVLDADPCVTFGFVLRSFDASRRAGVAGVQIAIDETRDAPIFVSSPQIRQSYRAFAKTEQFAGVSFPDDTPWGLAVIGAGPLRSKMPSIPRARGRLVGFPRETGLAAPAAASR